MSWRLIFAILILAAGTSAWGGLQLGDWLIAHGPTKPLVPVPPPELSKTPVLDANGKPFVATAPQPLLNGGQGIPEIMPPVDWQINSQSLMASQSKIALATTTITLEQTIALAAGEQLEPAGLDGIAQLTAGSYQNIQPIDVPPMPNAQPASQIPWQDKFHAALKACENVGFFSRPSCAWDARNKYCEPNNAWGKVDGCPARDY